MQAEYIGTATSLRAEEQAYAQIREQVAKAASVIAPVWPLKTFIARSPLQGLEHLPVEQALAQAIGLFQPSDWAVEQEAVNRQVIKWCQVFLDEGQATWMMPDRHLGFYQAWKAIAPLDDQLHQQSDYAKAWLADLPETPEDALLLCLKKLSVPASQYELFLRDVLVQLPGWAGYIKWRQDWQSTNLQSPNPITLVEYLAVRLAITFLLWPQAGQHPLSTPATGPAITAIVDRLEQRETTYRKNLLANLLPNMRDGRHATSQPDAQFVFCIDVRSEPFRRRLEAQGAYETLGFAGFFGIPVRVHNQDTDQAYDACPVLLKPKHAVDLQPVAANSSKLVHFQLGKRILNTVSQLYKALKYNFATPFALVETLGAGTGLLMLGRTLAPTLTETTRRRLQQVIQPRLQTKIVHHTEHTHGITSQEQVSYAASALRLMGLTDRFGKLVVFCGHGSTTQNNPYASALDCGACGGNHGGPNAKLLADILNTPFVRYALLDEGIAIPAETVFMAAEHNTTTDAVTLYESNRPLSESIDLEVIKRDLCAAQQENNGQRQSTLSGRKWVGNGLKAAIRRSNDWAEVRPEWGLARNAAFIVGPRHLSKGLDLDGRCFLHSYDWQQDPDQTNLATILTAPMVVAQWINAQYLFSTLDNKAYGSGSKITHNVVGKIGIMQGNASDLMHGLPLQSVNSGDDTPYHEPQRLLTVIVAPRYTIELVINRHAILQTLFYNGWATLVAIEPADNQAYKLDRAGQWHTWPNA